MKNNALTIKSLEDIAGFTVPSVIPKSLKEEIVRTYVNPTKYDLVGFIDRTNDVLLRPKYHTSRDAAGRFN